MPLLRDIAIIFAIVITVVLLSHRFRIPAIAGFLTAGIIAGPHGLGLVGAVHEVELMAEVGVILLLFVIGMEFSLEDIKHLKRPFLIGGGLQVGLTTVAVTAGSLVMGRTPPEALLIGFVVSLSSTAVVLKLLQDRAELEAPHGRAAFGTLIFQDIIVIPMMLAVPLLAGSSDASVVETVGGLLLRLLGVGVFVLVAARFIVPQLLYQIAKTKSREAFLISVLVICLGVALLTSEAGLSIALGAFLAGIVISESEYSHQAVGVILPFRDVFMSLFFVSVGMLLDLSYLTSHLGEIALLVLGILLIKPAAAGIATIAQGLPLRTAVIAGMSLGQIGEFSFILAASGVAAGLFDQNLFQTILACAVLSMLLTPVMIAIGPRVADAAVRLPLPRRLVSGEVASDLSETHGLSGHLVIVGYGVNGRNVAKSAHESGVPYAIVEINPEVVRHEQARGIDIHYGDSTQEAVLRHVNVESAKSVVIVINDPAAARRTTELARRLAPDAYIIVRTRYMREAGTLFELGANDVVADELEVSIEIFSRVLSKCLVPREDVERFTVEARAEWLDMVRSLSPEHVSPHDLTVHLPDVQTRSFRLGEGSHLAGLTIAESGLRRTQSVTVLGVRKGEKVISNPGGDILLGTGDILFVIAPVGWIPETWDHLEGDASVAAM